MNLHRHIGLIMLLMVRTGKSFGEIQQELKIIDAAIRELECSRGERVPLENFKEGGYL